MHYLAEVDYVDRVAFVLTLRGRMIAIGRYDVVRPGHAEVAFLVEDAYQGRGIGQVLLEHLAQAARERGISKFVAEVLPDNSRMIQTFRDAGYKVASGYEDGVISLEFPIEVTETAIGVLAAREHEADAASINRFFNPCIVAIIGASRRQETVGQLIVRNLVNGDFTGRVYVVNPNTSAVSGMPAYKSVAEIPDDVDVAIVAVPAEAVQEVVLDCAAKGVHGLVVISSGFAETGDEGRRRQRRLVGLSRSYGLRLIGPNALGIINTDPQVSINASLAPTMPPRGRAGFFCQSGALGSAILEKVNNRGLGLSTFVSAGNRADVSGNDLLQYWEEDASTEVVMMYLESIGNPRKFSRIARRVSLRKHVAGPALRDEFHTGFVYSDAWVQDARLVVLNAMDARDRGATVLTHTRCISARRDDDGWNAQLQSSKGESTSVRARALVNATGPWAVQFLDQVANVGHDHTLRLVKGSHIVVPRLFEHDHAYIFQQPDRRIVFAIPYEHDFTLIGTTDVDYRADPAAPHIDGEETRYLCEAANRYFKRNITPTDVVWNYSGVRPLLEDEEDNASEVSRDYLLELDTHGAPLLNVFGGKLTTARKLAEEALDRLSPLLPVTSAAWTAKGHPLPGGERHDIDVYQRELQEAHPWLPPALAWRLAHSYGTRSAQILGKARNLDELGPCFGADLYQAEVDYLREQEWVIDTTDVLWRRSKLGLRVGDDDVARLRAYLEQADLAKAEACMS